MKKNFLRKIGCFLLVLSMLCTSGFMGLVVMADTDLIRETYDEPNLALSTLTGWSPTPASLATDDSTGNADTWLSALVNDNKGGKALSFTKPNGVTGIQKTFTKQIPNGLSVADDTLVDISYRVKISDANKYTADFMNVIGESEQLAIQCMVTGGKLNFKNNASIVSTLSLAGVTGFISIQYIVDCKNDKYDLHVSYADSTGAPVKLDSEKLAFNAAATITGVKYLKLKTPTATFLTTEEMNYTFDDIIVKSVPRVTVTPLTIASTTPSSNSLSVGLNDLITVNFARDINSISLSNYFVLKNSLGETLPATVALAASNKVTVTPNSDLTESSSYTLTVKAGLTAVDGGALAADYTLKFSTIGPYNDNGIFDSKNTLNVVYLGGSITAGTGASPVTNRWADKVTNYLQQQYPTKTINGINKGWGGTGSDIGFYRLQRDVISNNPDMVFIEFAVNDKNFDVVDIKKYMEGMVRNLQALEKPPIIVYVYTTTSDFNAVSNSIAAHQAIADYYGIPSVNLRDYMKGLVDSGVLTTTDFLDDGTHPNNLGYQYYADYIIGKLRYDTTNYLKNFTHRSTKLTDCYEFTTKFDPATYSKVDSGWTNMTSYYGSTTPGSVLTYEFYGPMIAIQQKISRDGGKYDVEIDGVYQATQDTYYDTGGMSIIWYKNMALTNTKHTLKLTVSDQSNASSTGNRIAIDTFIVSNDDIDVFEVSRSSPANNSVDFKVDSPLTLEFTRKLNPDSVNTSNFIVSKSSGASANVLPSLNSDGKTVTLTPVTPFEPGTLYDLTVKSSVLSSVGGMNLNSDYKISFTTSGEEPGVLVNENYNSVTNVANLTGWSPSLSTLTGWTFSIENGALKFAKPATVTTGSATLNKTFEDRGDGIYQISYKFKPEKSVLYPQYLLSAIGYQTQQDGTKTEVPVNQILVYNNTQLIFKYADNKQFTIISDLSSVSGWINVNYTVNTKKDVYSLNVAYTNTSNVATTVTKDNWALLGNVDGLKGLRLQFAACSNTAEGLYWFDDISVKKLSEPSIVSVTPVDGTAGTSLRPNIGIVFNSLMNETTLTKSNIKVLKDGIEIDPGMYNLAVGTSAGVSNASISFNNDLDYKTHYSISVSNAILSAGDMVMNLDKNYITTFTTKAMAFDVESVTVVDSTNNPVTSLADVAGKKVTVRMILKNNEVALGQPYVASITLNDDKNVMLNAYINDGNITQGNSKTVITEMDVPLSANSSYKIDCFAWESFVSMKPLSEKVVKP